MIRYKTFDSTGIATGGRLYAADLNAIQDAAAGLTDLTQNVSVGSVIVGEVGLALSRFGAGEVQVSGAFRSSGILRGTGGLYAGQFTTTTRNAIAAGGAPNGLIIFNTTTGQFEWNFGSDGARVWKALGYDPAGDIVLTGAASSLDFTDQGAANYFLTSKRTADTVARFAIKEDGTIEFGPGGVTARDVIMFRSGVGVLSLGAAVKLILGSNGIQFSDGTTINGTDSITAALIAANAITASELADNAVDANAIQADAVTTVKILDGNVTLNKLAALSVDASKIVAALKPSGTAAAGTEALRALGTTAGTALAGDAPGALVPVAVVGGTKTNGGTYTITAPVAGTYILEFGAGKFDAGAGSTCILTSNKGGEVAYGDQDGQRGAGTALVAAVVLTAAEVVTITAALSGNANQILGCWAKLTRTV